MTSCPNCGHELTAAEKAEEVELGGMGMWVCPNCGLEIDLPGKDSFMP
ncbi:zf-TFIIB domain-containing protein [Herbiconiux sp. UC225_62]